MLGDYLKPVGSRGYDQMDSTGLTAEDRERISAYLEQPAHARETTDLVPDEDHAE